MYPGDDAESVAARGKDDPPRADRKPVVIGLLGGVASGKSTVAAILSELGCAVADADRICHAALRDVEVRDAVVARFGPAILDGDGAIDRARLRAVFDDPEALARLERILHPIAIEQTRRVIRLAARDGRPGVVVDAALLLEAGMNRLCDVLVLVDVTEANRRARARSRGLGEADWARRERHQLPVDEKRRCADHVLDANGSPDAVRAVVVALWSRLTGST